MAAHRRFSFALARNTFRRGADGCGTPVRT
jgi:hypothetical protein